MLNRYAMNDCKVRVIDRIEDFESLKMEWNDLLSRSHSNVPFLTFEWQFSWWRNFGKGRTLSILVISDAEDKLLAILPLCRRKLLWLTIYEFIGADRSDYLDIITADPREKVLPMALEYLLKRGKRPHIINLENLYLEKDQLENIKRSARASGFASHHRTSVRSPYIKINSNWEDFLKNRGNGFRKKVSKKEKRLMGKGDIEVVLVREFNSNDKRIGNIFEVAKKIEQESWKFKEGSPRILTSKFSERFYSEFLERFSENGWLDSWFAIFQGTPVAYAFNINYGQKIFAYNAAYDGRYKEYGLGALLHIKRIRNAFEHSSMEYDFLRGEEEYKKFWTDDFRELQQLVLFNKNPVGYLFYLACFKLRWILSRSRFMNNLRKSLRRQRKQEND